eukprot:7152242-Prymnesium_polylepis.1
MTRRATPTRTPPVPPALAQPPTTHQSPLQPATTVSQAFVTSGGHSQRLHPAEGMNAHRTPALSHAISRDQVLRRPSAQRVRRGQPAADAGAACSRRANRDGETSAHDRFGARFGGTPQGARCASCAKGYSDCDRPCRLLKPAKVKRGDRPRVFAAARALRQSARKP